MGIDQRQPIELVAFDLDGTLLDSATGIVRAVAGGLGETLLSHGSSEATASDERIAQALGQPADRFFRELLPTSLQHLAAEAQERSTAHEIKALRSGGVRLFGGVITTLELLRRQSRSLALISNAQRGYFETAAEALGLNDFVSFQMCHDDLPQSRKAEGKRALLSLALDAMSIAPDRCAMVGDRHDDIEAARAVGCMAIGIAGGFGSADELKDAHIVLDGVSNLPAAFLELGC